VNARGAAGRPAAYAQLAAPIVLIALPGDWVLAGQFVSVVVVTANQ
jgi:hypothetical protein